MERIPLRTGSEICCGAKKYVIEGVLGAGASCLAYSAKCSENGITTRRVLKELYPEGAEITRLSDGGIVVAAKDMSLFEEKRERFLNAAFLQAKIRDFAALTNRTPPLNARFDANNTCYLDITSFEGKTLSRLGGLSARDAVRVSLSVSRLVFSFHKAGYLCLDIKPENIFVLPETLEMVEFLDFDSIVNFFAAGEFPLSFTRSWAAPEQICGGEISERTDIFLLGELLFFLLFGRHSSENERTAFAEYPFDECKELRGLRAKKLCREIFEKTVRSGAENRFSSAELLIKKLAKLLSELQKTVRIVSAARPAESFFIGRAREINELEGLLQSEKTVFLTGMGGIGKSTITRRFLQKNYNKFDNIVCLDFRNSLRETLADDFSFRIENVLRSREETTEEYLTRKLGTAAELLSGKNNLLVIDNFSGKLDDDFAKISLLDWKILIISRENRFKKEFPTIEISAMESEIFSLFTHYSGLEIGDGERPLVNEIIEKTAAHTLAVKLIARGISLGHLSLEKAARLINKNGFSRFSEKNVDIIKDSRSYSDTILNIISAVFSNEDLSEKSLALMKCLSLFGTSAQDAKRLCEALSITSTDEIRELERLGQINFIDGKISLHPVIFEAVSKWKWNALGEKKALRLMELLDEKIKALAGNSPFEQTLFYLGQAEKVIENGGYFSRCESFERLLLCVITNMPHDREEFILGKSEELIKNARRLENADIMRLYDYMIFVRLERGELDLAREKMREAKRFSRRGGNYSSAIYYDILATYYDALQGGNYDLPESKRILNAVEKSIYFMEKSGCPESREALARYALSRANVLIRAFPERKGEIISALGQARRLIKQNCPKNIQLKNTYYLVAAWYFTYVELAPEKACRLVLRADKCSKKIFSRDIRFIEEMLVPTANILFECEKFRYAAMRIKIAVAICEKNAEIAAYQRKREELSNILREIKTRIKQRD